MSVICHPDDKGITYSSISGTFLIVPVFRTPRSGFWQKVQYCMKEMNLHRGATLSLIGSRVCGVKHTKWLEEVMLQWYDPG